MQVWRIEPNENFRTLPDIIGHLIIGGLEYMGVERERLYIYDFDGYALNFLFFEDNPELIVYL